MANYWPGLGYITLRRTTTTAPSTRRPSIPSTSTPTRSSPPSSTANYWPGLGYIRRRTTTTPSSSPTTPRPSSSSTTRGKSTCACSPTNHPGSYRCALHRNSANNNGNKRLNTNATTTSKNNKEAQGGHFPTSDRVDLPRKVLAKSLLQMAPAKAKLVRESLHRGQHSSSSHHRGGAALQPRASRLSIMASG